MKSLALTAVATILSASAALASTDLADFDTNGDRFASKAEVSAVFPGFTASDFRGLDGNRDQRISASELNAPGARAIVARYEDQGTPVLGIADLDVSGDGFATIEELRVTYPGLTAQDFRRIDANRDNRVSFGELYAPLAQTKISRHEVTPSQVGISDLDTNGDNFAQFGELAAAFPGLNAIDFDDIDTNNDNRVSFGELYELDAQVILDRSGS